jgi:hypothetical protein
MYNTSNKLIDIQSVDTNNLEILSNQIHNMGDVIPAFSSHDYELVHINRYISLGPYYRFVVYRHLLTLEYNPTPWITDNWTTIPPYIIKPIEANEPDIIEKNKAGYDTAYNIYLSAEIEYGTRGAHHASFLAEYNCIASYYVIQYIYENIDDTEIYIDSPTSKYEIINIRNANKIEGNAYIQIQIVAGSKETNRFSINIEGINHYIYYFDSILVNTDQLTYVF